LFVSIEVLVVLCFYFFFFFFFSSRRRHTRSYGDWSSDVCSSDLSPRRDTSGSAAGRWTRAGGIASRAGRPFPRRRTPPVVSRSRSEERRVGKECRSRGAADQ